jgi:uncharacterized protein YcaQ
MPFTLEDLRRYAVARTLFNPTTLKRALERMGFVQADPIRAPARAQDLVLRHRVRGYRAGDLEQRYESLDIEEDVFVVYGFVTRRVSAMMHPRASAGRFAGGVRPWPSGMEQRARELLDFVRQRGSVHPREVDEHLSHGKVTNYWGGVSKASTHLLAEMHYRGMLRVRRRDRGIRIFAAHEHGPEPDVDERVARIDALVDVAVNVYAPVPAPSLNALIQRLRYAAPQWRGELKDAFRRARERLTSAVVDGVAWYWPAGENPRRAEAADKARLLTPFDPLVWDRARFELLWEWQYRFEAYTPAKKRRLGYYALPLLWRDYVIGWANVSVVDDRLSATLGYVGGRPPRERVFRTALDLELERMREFLGVSASSGS